MTFDATTFAHGDFINFDRGGAGTGLPYDFEVIQPQGVVYPNLSASRQDRVVDYPTDPVWTDTQMAYSSKVHTLAKTTLFLGSVSILTSVAGLVAEVKSVSVVGALLMAAAFVSATIWIEQANAERAKSTR